MKEEIIDEIFGKIAEAVNNAKKDEETEKSTNERGG